MTIAPAPATFGSLDALLRDSDEGMKLLCSSPGPVADAFLLDLSEVSALCGPQGSAKTTTCAKRAVLRTMRMPPWAGGVRRYTLGVFRETYGQLWDGTVKSFKPIFRDGLDGVKWVGSRPNPADLTVWWRDPWGECEMNVAFRAFGEDADPNSLRGVQLTDAYLNEMDTMPEKLFEWLIGRVGRNPVETILGRPGMIFGDLNAPDVLNWTYRDFWEDPKPGYRLYLQPGGMDPAAENRQFVGLPYYERQARLNAHRPWWVRRMVHNRPGFSHDGHLVYPEYVDETMRSPTPLEVFPELPVIIGCDAGDTTHAAAVLQFAYGQCRVLAELWPEHGGATELGEMLAEELAKPRYADCQFMAILDPAGGAGAGTAIGSAQQRLEKASGVKVRLAPTNEPNLRHAGLRAYMKVVAGKPMFVLDPSIRSIRRGLNQTYQWVLPRGGDTHLRVDKKQSDSHRVEALEYGCFGAGVAAVLDRQRARAQEREARRREGRAADRYNPLRRRG